MGRFHRIRLRLIPRFHQINRNDAVAWTQYARVDDNHSIKCLWITDRRYAFRSVTAIRSKVLGPSKRCRQRLTPLRAAQGDVVAFLVEGPVEVVARMRSPITIAARVHDKYLALP